jgi:hypothetical protein
MQHNEYFFGACSLKGKSEEKNDKVSQNLNYLFFV